MTRKRVLRIILSGILLVYATGILFSNFSSSPGSSQYFEQAGNGRLWIAQGPISTSVHFFSEGIWGTSWYNRLEKMIPSAGTQAFIYSKSPLDALLVKDIVNHELDMVSATPPVEQDLFEVTTVVVGIGLPFESFRYRIDIVKGKNGVRKLIHHDSLGISGKYIPGLESWQSFTVPLMPLFPGFAVNVLVWGIFAWGMEYVIRGVFFALKFLLGINRRKLRATRKANNQCVPCGYPRGQFDTCPECGSAVEYLAMNED